MLEKIKMYEEEIKKNKNAKGSRVLLRWKLLTLERATANTTIISICNTAQQTDTAINWNLNKQVHQQSVAEPEKKVRVDH